MIDTLYFALGFIIYVVFTLITFNTYSNKNQMPKVLVLIFIYAFYTLLAGYVISFVDFNASFFEKLIQILIYAIAAGLFLYSHYKNTISKSEVESGYGESPDSKMF